MNWSELKISGDSNMIMNTLLTDRLFIVDDAGDQYLPDEAIRNIDLHYSSTGIEVDLYLRREELESELAAQLKESLRVVTSVARLNIYCSILEADINTKLT